VAECLACSEEIRKSGHYVTSEALQPAHTATTVRVRNGKLSATDGPFAETKEQLGGFYLIDAGDLNDAIRVASRMPQARRGSVEGAAAQSLTSGRPSSVSSAAGRQGRWKTYTRFDRFVPMSNSSLSPGATPIVRPLPRWISPQLAKLVDQAPSGERWAHEIKYDGYRLNARIDHGRVALLTRTELDWT
jgi:hypothetical protein